VGSVAAGGRYDNLVSMFSGKTPIPCVGISFGVDRIFSITKARSAAAKAPAVRTSEVDVYVMAFGGKGFTGLLPERMEVARTLWDAGIKAEFSYKLKPKLPQQFKKAEEGGVPFAVILGEEEVERGVVKVKEMGLPEGHAEKDGVEVEMKMLVSVVREKLEGLKKTEGSGGLAEGLKTLDVGEGAVVG
jgi:histidyl-tRNA synthetase